jgi:hypothetical protein
MDLGEMSKRAAMGIFIIVIFTSMKLLLDIEDRKAGALLSLLKDLKYVKAETLTLPKAKFLSELKEAVDELNLIKQGKRKARNAADFLNEL